MTQADPVEAALRGAVLDRSDGPALMKPAQWRSLGRIGSRNGRQIFEVDSARGEVSKPSVLCLHGFPTSSWDWVDIWPTVTEHHRLVAFDFFGFGFSEKPRGGRLSIDEQADVAEAVADAAHLDRYHVLAHDYGDTVAQELLARDLARPSSRRRLRSVVFLNGGLFPETHRALVIQRLLAGPLGPWLSRTLGRRAFGRSFSAVFGPATRPSPQQLDHFWSLIERDGGRAVFHRAITYMAERREKRDRWVGALQAAACPLALINGSADPVSGEHMVQRYREVVRATDHTVELPSIGHYPQVEAPAAVAAALVEFWQSQT